MDKQFDFDRKSLIFLEDAKVYLFGSVAEGKAVPSSDIDILIVTGREELQRVERGQSL